MSETLQKLLDTAENDIRLRGYHAVSFRDLADEIGIKSSSVHYYFRQKEDLGLALVERYAARFFGELNRRTEKAQTPDERIRAFCGIYREVLISSDRICLCVMLGSESPGLPVALAAAVAAFFKANIDWLVTALPDTLSAEERQQKAANIVATLQGAMVLASGLKNHAVFDDAIEGLLA